LRPKPQVVLNEQKEYLRLAEALLDQYQIPYTYDSRDSQVRGMEVGDDRISCSHTPLPLAITQIAQERLFRMKTSVEDTFISSTLYNLAEVTSVIPAVKTSGFNYTRSGRVTLDLDGRKQKSHNDFRDFGFIDCPSLRTIVDTSKGDGDNHISSAIGKAAFIKTRTTARRNLRTTMHLASLFQDAMLNTAKSPDPKYMPAIMGGTGNPALFDQPKNVYLYIHYYRGGSMQRIYASASEEVRNAVGQLDGGRTPSELMISTKLRQREEYLHGTFKDLLAIPNVDRIRETLQTKENTIGKPLYYALPINSGLTPVEQNLVNGKVLLTKKSAEIEVEKTIKNSIVLFGSMSRECVNNHARYRRREDTALVQGALRANTAFSNLLNRKAKGGEIDKLRAMGFDISAFGQRRFTFDHALCVTQGFRGNMYTAEDLYLPQDMYLRKEVSTEETLKVGGIHLTIPTETGYKFVETVSRVGLYNITGSRKEWTDKLEVILSEERERYGGAVIPYPVIQDIFTKDRNWVNDDSLLVGMALEALNKGTWSPRDFFFLVSTDRGLARRMADATKHYVLMINPVELMVRFPETPVNELESTVRGIGLYNLTLGTKPKNFKLWISALWDTGSERSHASHREVIHGRTHVRQSMSSKYTKTGHRVELVRFKPDYISEEVKTYVIAPSDRPKTSKVFTVEPQGSDYSSRTRSRASIGTFDFDDEDHMFHVGIPD